MSWDGYLDHCSGNAKGHVDRVAIIGKNGSLYNSPNYKIALKLKGNEIQALGQMGSSGQFNSGATVEGVKYMFLSGNDNIFRLKKAKQGSLVVGVCNTCLVVAHVAEGKQIPEATSGVEATAKYLMDNNL